MQGLIESGREAPKGQGILQLYLCMLKGVFQLQGSYFEATKGMNRRAAHRILPRWASNCEQAVYEEEVDGVLPCLSGGVQGMMPTL